LLVPAKHLFSKSVSQKVFMKSFFKSQFPHKSVNLFFILVIRKDKLTDLCWNSLLKNDLIKTLCEIEIEFYLVGLKKIPLALGDDAAVLPLVVGARETSLSHAEFCLKYFAEM